MPTNDITAIEGIDIYNSYELICIDRVNSKLIAFATDIANLIASVNTINTTIGVIQTDIATLQTNLATTNTNLETTNTNLATTNTNLATTNTNLATTNTNLATTNTNLNTLTTNFNNMRLIVNVKDYGATGDGTTDDTTNIKTAISNLPASNGILYFPKGTYVVSQELTINSKSNLLIKSDSASIKATANVYTIVFISCPYLTFVEGRLEIFTTTTGLASNCGFAFNKGRGSKIKNVIVRGDFNIGAWIYGADIYSTGVALPAEVNVVAYQCRYGIVSEADAEYTIFSNCIVSYCTITGLLLKETGNILVLGGSYNYNGIGIEVLGNKTTGNSDHGRIVGTTINHNNRCGLFINKIRFTFGITDCDIWANNNGLYTNPQQFLSTATNVDARNYCYNIYIQDAQSLTLTGNRICNNAHINVGVDGICNTSFINNLFRADGQTINHYFEFGINNTTYGRNRFVIISNNIFTGSLSGSFDGNTGRIIRFDNSLSQDGVYVIRDNTGDTNDRGVTSDNAFIQFINTANQSYWIGHKEFTHISSPNIGITNTTTTNPNDQPTNIYIPSALLGSKFTIYIDGGQSPSYARAIWIRINSNNSDVPIIIGTNVFFSTFYKALKIYDNVYKIDFIPRGASGLAGWLIDPWTF